MRKLYFLLAIYWTLVAFPTAHPITSTGGYTGAPQDSFCSTCHGNQNQSLAGDLSLLGLPSTVTVGETHRLTLQITNPSINAVRAGFQLVALESDLANAGSFTKIDNNTSIRQAGNKQYMGHTPALNFSGDTLVSWEMDWTVEENDEGTLTFYAGGVIGNGGNGNSRDRTVFRSFSTEVQAAISGNFEILENPYCDFDQTGMLAINVQNGMPPFQYSWSNGDTTAIIDSIIAGNFKVEVMDAEGGVYIDSIDIPAINAQIQNVQVLQNGLDSFSIIPSFTRPMPAITYSAEDGSNEVTVQDTIINNIPPGVYKVFGISEGGCVSDTVVVEVNTLSNQDDIVTEVIKIFPNPAREYLNWTDDRVKQIAIYDVQGRELMRQTVSEKSIDVTSLASGQYFIRFSELNVYLGTARFVVLR